MTFGELDSSDAALVDRQDTQLSQRDRAAGCVSFGQKWKTGTEKQYFKGHYRSIFNNCDIISLQSIELGKKRKIRVITPFKVIQGHQGRYQWKARMPLSISY